MSVSQLKFGIFATLVVAFIATPFYSVNAQFATVEAPGPLLTAAAAAAASTAASAEALGFIQFEQVVQTGIQGAISTGVGVPGTGATVIALARNLINVTCKPIILSFNSLTTAAVLADANSSAILSIIGGGAAETTKLSAQINKAVVAQGCVDQYVETLSQATGDLNILTELAREQDKYTKISVALGEAIQTLSARQSAGAKDIARAFMVKLILNLNKNLTTQFVNEMVNKFKISDYLAYGNAVATQVYSMKYINENYSGDARQQMMIRSILQSDKLPEKLKTIQSFANSKAQEYLGQACNVANGGSNSNDAYFIRCLAAYGSPKANAQFHYLEAYDQAQAARVAGAVSSAAEVSQSNGYAPARNCGGSLAEQQQIDLRFDLAESEKLIAEDAASRLGKALSLNPTPAQQAEYNKARAAADQAVANAKALEKEISNPIIDICNAIDSPSSFVSNGIEDFLKQHLDQASQLKSDNLPFYANFLADVASNFLTNILTGGKSTSQVLKEGGVGALNGALIGVAQTLGNGAGGVKPNPGGDITMSVVPQGSSAPTTTLTAGQRYLLTIDFTELFRSDPVFNPYRMQIDGVNFEDDECSQVFGCVLTPGELSAKRIRFDFTAPASSFNINIQFFTREDAPIHSSGGWKQSYTVSQVKGVSIVLPRGPQVSFR